jgi:hypothetical protein
MIALSCSESALRDEALTLKIAKLEPIPTHQPFSFIVYGDPKGNVTIHRRLIEIFLREKHSSDIAFIASVGDMVKDESKKDESKEKEWKKYFIDVVQPILPSPSARDSKAKAPAVPYFLAIGNHDYDAKGGESFAKLFGMYYAAYDFWYAFVYGNSIFIMLDANLITNQEEFHIPKERAERQYHWLEKVLKSASSDARIKHKFVFFHQPPFVSARKRFFGSLAYHLDDAEELRTYRIGDDFFLDIFRKYDVDAVFLGHVHYYERWVEQYERDGRKRQITWVTTAGGGAKNGLLKWRGLRLGIRPPKVLTENERDERIRPYDLRAKSAKDITNWSIFQGYPTRKSETLRALEKHYCVVHVDGDSVWMEVKNKEQALIETAHLVFTGE